MNNPVILDWKSIAALGLTAVCLVLVVKDPQAAKEALVHVSDAVKECALAYKSSR